MVSGSLTEEQESGLFGWGAFVQLADDLQDVERDADDGLLTVFLQTAGRWSLDGITDRAMHFGRKVVERLACFAAPSAAPVRQLMETSTLGLLTEAAGAASHLYTPAYVRDLESHSPFRFSFLAERRKHMAGHSASLVGLVEAFAKLDDGSAPAPFILP